MNSSAVPTFAKDLIQFLIAKTFVRTRILLAQCSALKASWPAVYGLGDLCYSLLVGLSSNPHMQVSFLSMLQVLI